MKERRPEIIIFSICAVITFFGGLVFAFSTPPTIYDLVITFFYGMVSSLSVLKVLNTIIEAKKVDDEWREFISGGDLEEHIEGPLHYIECKKRNKFNRCC